LAVGAFVAVGVVLMAGMAMAGTTTFEANYLSGAVTGLVSSPVLKFALQSKQLYYSHRNKYCHRRYLREQSRKAAEERRRRDAAVVPSKPIETFESRLKVVANEHEERLEQLQLLPIDTEERDYLVELEQSRFHDQIRALTDSSLSLSNIDEEQDHFSD
jgi:hypothetical protein